MSKAINPDGLKLRDIFESQKNTLGLTHRGLADQYGSTPGAISGYLNGYNPLNIKFAAFMAKQLGVPISAFSERLAKEAEELYGLLTVSDHTVQLVEDNIAVLSERANAALLGVTKGVLERRLWSSEVEVLEAIAKRLVSE